MIRVVNKKTHKPTSNDVYIGRPSPLGNPFTYIQDGKTLAKYIVANRDEAVDEYRKYLSTALDTDPVIKREFARLRDLCMKGDVNLVCWCAPQKCHGHVLKLFLDYVIEESGG